MTLTCRQEVPQATPRNSWHGSSHSCKLCLIGSRSCWILTWHLMLSCKVWVQRSINLRSELNCPSLKDIFKQIDSIQQDSYDDHLKVTHSTIFHEILSSKLPPEEKSSTRLWQDGQVTVIAVRTVYCLESVLTSTFLYNWYHGACS